MRRVASTFVALCCAAAAGAPPILSPLPEADILLVPEPVARPTGGGHRLSETELGLLVVSPPPLRQAIGRHHVVVTHGGRLSLLEDLSDLESDLYSVDLKLSIRQRMYRTQPALMAAGSSGRHGQLALSRPRYGGREQLAEL